MNFLFEGLLLGLTLGTTCLVTCAPVYGSLIMSAENTISSGVRTVFIISLGRFISYAVFGLLTGLAGSLIGDSERRDTLIAVSYIAVALYLTYSAFIQNRKEKGCCPASRYAAVAGNPFLIGLLTGISVCPSFLGAITKGIDTGGPLGGMLLFTGFFFGTTVYLLPLSFLSYFTKRSLFRYVGIFASLAVAVWFIYEGSSKLYDQYNSYIMNFTETPVAVVISNPSMNDETQIRSGFKVTKIERVEFDDIEKTIEDLTSDRDIVLITTENFSQEQIADLKKMNKNILHIQLDKNSTDISKQIEFIKYYSFKGRRSKGFFYTVPVN